MKRRWQPKLPTLGRGAETCERKRRYETWDDARLAGMAVWRENPRPTDANPALPYVCLRHRPQALPLRPHSLRKALRPFAAPGGSGPLPL